MHDFLLPIYRFLDPIFLVYFGLILISYAVFFILGAIGTVKRFHRTEAEDYTNVLKLSSLPEITFIIPTYNGSRIILSCIDNLRQLTYQYKKIIVVIDGSTDNTLNLLIETFKLEKIPIFFHEKLPTKPCRGCYRSLLHPEIFVLDKENGDKNDALNMGLNACQTTYFTVVDDDTIIEENEFKRLIRPIFSNPNTIAIGAAIKIRNGCELKGPELDTSEFPPSFIVGAQALEYLRAFLMRVGWEFIGNNYIISGAFGVFIRDVVIESGGFGPTIANDLEIILRLTRVMKATKTPYRIIYRPDPVAWTYVPTTWKALAYQRVNWQRGTLESLWFNKTVFLNPKYGMFGLFVHPYLVLFEAIEPLVEIVGYIYIIVGIILGVINFYFISLFLLITIGFVFIQTLFSFAVEDFSFRKFSNFKTVFYLILYSVIENFGYRQMNLIWRTRGIFDFFKKFKEVRKNSQKINAVVNETIKKGPLHW